MNTTKIGDTRRRQQQYHSETQDVHSSDMTLGAAIHPTSHKMCLETPGSKRSSQFDYTQLFLLPIDYYLKTMCYNLPNPQNALDSTVSLRVFTEITTLSINCPTLLHWDWTYRKQQTKHSRRYQMNNDAVGSYRYQNNGSSSGTKKRFKSLYCLVSSLAEHFKNQHVLANIGLRQGRTDYWTSWGMPGTGRSCSGQGRRGKI